MLSIDPGLPRQPNMMPYHSHQCANLPTYSHLWVVGGWAASISCKQDWGPVDPPPVTSMVSPQQPNWGEIYCSCSTLFRNYFCKFVCGHILELLEPLAILKFGYKFGYSLRGRLCVREIRHIECVGGGGGEQLLGGSLGLMEDWAVRMWGWQSRAWVASSVRLGNQGYWGSTSADGHQVISTLHTQEVMPPAPVMGMIDWEKPWQWVLSLEWARPAWPASRLHRLLSFSHSWGASL